IQQELPLLLESMPTRSVQDYENRLARLRQVPRVVDRTLELLAQGLAAGITPPRVTLRDVPAQFASLLTSDPMKSPVLETFHEIGLAEVARIRGEMETLIAATGFQGSFADFSRFLRTDPRFFYDKPEDLLMGYRDIAKRIDPELVKLFGRLPRLPYGVRAVSD